MNIFKLSLLLIIPFSLFMKTEVGNKNNNKPIAKFNSLIKGSGNPTIVFESGLGTPLSNWDKIQASISANYKTISYDRKGIGGTQATDSPRTIENLVKDLDTLISQNEINGPIVLVGHSLGGHIVRKYQQTFPSKVAGLFLIEPTNEYIYEEIFNSMSKESADSMKTAWDNSYKKKAIGVYNEWKEVYTIDKIMRNHPLPTSIPITILASYQENNFLTKQNIQIKEKQFSDWKKDKPNVKILNTTNSGHYIHLGEPEWVITELEAYLKSLK